MKEIRFDVKTATNEMGVSIEKAVGNNKESLDLMTHLANTVYMTIDKLVQNQNELIAKSDEPKKREEIKYFELLYSGKVIAAEKLKVKILEDYDKFPF